MAVSTPSPFKAYVNRADNKKPIPGSAGDGFVAVKTFTVAKLAANGPTPSGGVPPPKVLDVLRLGHLRRVSPGVGSAVKTKKGGRGLDYNARLRIPCPGFDGR